MKMALLGACAQVRLFGTLRPYKGTIPILQQTNAEVVVTLPWYAGQQPKSQRTQASTIESGKAGF